MLEPPGAESCGSQRRTSSTSRCPGSCFGGYVREVRFKPALSPSAFAADLECNVYAPGVAEDLFVQVGTGMPKTLGDFTFNLDLHGETVIAISIKGNVRDVFSHTIATAGAGIFAKPRQLSLEIDGRYAAVNCW